MTAQLAVRLALEEAAAFRIVVSVVEETHEDGTTTTYPCRQEYFAKIFPDDGSWTRRIHLIGDAHPSGVFQTEW